GLRHGVIALTKCDLVDETTREVVELEIRDLVQGTFLENAPLLRTSAHTGEGIPELKAAIAEACRKVEERTPSPPTPLPSGERGESSTRLPSGERGKSLTPLPSGERGRGEGEWFRMAIDRSFIVQGHGTVVTGSVTSGSLQVGDELEWQPRGERVRVRSLQNHDQPVDEVHRGM